MKTLSSLIIMLIAIFCMTTVVMSSEYKIQSGDTLGSIAVSHNTTVSRLAEINSLKPPYKIYYGRLLRLDSIESALPVHNELISSLREENRKLREQLAQKSKSDPDVDRVNRCLAASLAEKDLELSAQTAKIADLTWKLNSGLAIGAISFLSVVLLTSWFYASRMRRKSDCEENEEADKLSGEITYHCLPKSDFAEMQKELFLESEKYGKRSVLAEAADLQTSDVNIDLELEDAPEFQVEKLDENNSDLDLYEEVDVEDANHPDVNAESTLTPNDSDESVAEVETDSEIKCDFENDDAESQNCSAYQCKIEQPHRMSSFAVRDGIVPSHNTDKEAIFKLKLDCGITVFYTVSKSPEGYILPIPLPSGGRSIGRKDSGLGNIEFCLLKFVNRYVEGVLGAYQHLENDIVNKRVVRYRNA